MMNKNKLHLISKWSLGPIIFILLLFFISGIAGFKYGYGVHVNVAVGATHCPVDEPLRIMVRNNTLSTVDNLSIDVLEINKSDATKIDADSLYIMKKVEPFRSIYVCKISLMDDLIKAAKIYHAHDLKELTSDEKLHLKAKWMAEQDKKRRKWIKIMNSPQSTGEQKYFSRMKLNEINSKKYEYVDTRKMNPKSLGDVFKSTNYLYKLSSRVRFVVKEVN